MAVINKMYPLTLLALAASLAACGGGGGGGNDEPPRNTQQPPLTTLPAFLQDQTQHCEFTENGQVVALVDYRGNLANVTALRCSGTTLASLQGIGELSGLLQVSLPATGLTDLDELVAIGARLTHLNLAGNNITDLGQIGQFGALTHLDLSSNQLVDVGPLVDLLNLVELNLESNAITTISALSALTQLTSLQLAGNAQLNCNDVFALTNSLETVDSGTIIMPPAHCASALRLGDSSPASLTLNNSTEAEPYGQVLVASGYSTSHLSMRQSGNNLIVTLTTAAGPRSVTFTDWFVSTAHRVGSFTVSGESYTFTQLRSQIGLGLQVPAGGAPFTGSNERDVIFGTDGNDHINGGIGSDVLIGGKGDDILAGQSVSFTGAGIPQILGTTNHNTYIYDQGDGNDTIYQYGNFRGLLHFRNNITPDDITLVRSGDNLIFDMAGDNSVTIYNWFYNSAFRVGQLQFGSNSPVSADDFVSQKGYSARAGEIILGTASSEVLIGTGLDDQINGWSGADTLVGGKGDDILAGQSVSFTGAGIPQIAINHSHNTYIYDQGDGNDTIYQYGNFRGLLHFRNNITPDDITLVRSGDNLIFDMAGDNSVTIYNWFYNSAYRVGQLQFGNNAPVNAGTFVNARPIHLPSPGTLMGTDEDNILQGTSGNDFILGLAGSDTLIGGNGDDVLAGQSVSFTGAGIPQIAINHSHNTYIYDQGDGNDTIYQYGNFRGLLHFRNNITPDDITLVRSGDNLIFDMAGDNSVTIYNWFYNSAFRVGQLQFGDSAPINAEEFVSARLTP